MKNSNDEDGMRVQEPLEDPGADEEQEEVFHLPLEDTLDLHHFRASEVKDLVPEYLEEAQKAGFAEVRIIHGKGKGVLREIVHSILSRHPAVAGYRLADARGGGWGATIAALKVETSEPSKGSADAGDSGQGRAVAAGGEESFSESVAGDSGAFAGEAGENRVEAESPHSHGSERKPRPASTFLRLLITIVVGTALWLLFHSFLLPRWFG
jgi:hypothetical protein